MPQNLRFEVHKARFTKCFACHEICTRISQSGFACHDICTSRFTKREVHKALRLKTKSALRGSQSAAPVTKCAFRLRRLAKSAWLAKSVGCRGYGGHSWWQAQGKPRVSLGGACAKSTVRDSVRCKRDRSGFTSNCRFRGRRSA